MEMHSRVWARSIEKHSWALVYGQFSQHPPKLVDSSSAQTINPLGSLIPLVKWHLFVNSTVLLDQLWLFVTFPLFTSHQHIHSLLCAPDMTHKAKNKQRSCIFMQFITAACSIPLLLLQAPQRLKHFIDIYVNVSIVNALKGWGGGGLIQGANLALELGLGLKFLCF